MSCWGGSYPGLTCAVKDSGAKNAAFPGRVFVTSAGVTSIVLKVKTMMNVAGNSKQ